MVVVQAYNLSIALFLLLHMDNILMSNMNSENNESCEDLNELIIHYVKSCPEIWDIKNKNYKDNNLKMKKWGEIARELNVPDNFVKSRWRTIRDRYLKERKKLLTKSGQAATKCTMWSLMPHLEFLTETVEARQTISNLQDNVQITEVFTPSQYMIPIQSTVSPIKTTESSIQSTSSSIQNCEVEISGYMKSSSSQQNSQRLTPVLMSDTPYISLKSPSPILQNLNSPCSSTVSSPHSSLTSRPPSTSISCPSNSSRTKKRKSESLDPVDEAILNLTSEKTKRDSLSNFTSDDLFYLSISRDTQQLNIRDKMRLKQTVLNTLSEILNNNSIIE